MGPKNFDILLTTGTELQTLLQQSVITSSEVVQKCLARIEDHNTSGRKLRAIIAVAPKDDVLALANTLDQERAGDKTRSQLHGVPIIIKVCMLALMGLSIA